jgi:hypothetical protein
MVTDHPSLRACGALLLFTLACPAADLPAYRLDDIVRDDVITPMRLTVVDAEATRERQSKEARKIPMHVRYDTGRVHQVESAIRDEAARVRQQFLDALEAEYGKRRLSIPTTQKARFRTFWQGFAQTQKPFPRLFGLYRAWATGTEDGSVFEECLVLMKETMCMPIRAKYSPGKRPGSNAVVRLVQVANLEGAVDVESVQSNASPVRAGSLLSLWSAREALRARFPQTPNHVQSYFAGKVQANCRLDRELTERIRQSQVSSLLVTENFEAGEAILQAGQTVDEPGLAALTALREKLQIQHLEKRVVTQSAENRRVHERALWLGGLLLGVTVVLAAVGIASAPSTFHAACPRILHDPWHAGR